MQPKLTWNHCNTLQRTATHCNTLQRPATHLDLESLPHAAKPKMQETKTQMEETKCSPN